MLTFHKNTVNLTNSVSWDISPIIPKSTNYTYITAHSHLRNERFVPSNSYYINLKFLGINENEPNTQADSNSQLLYTQNVSNKNMYKQTVALNRSFKMQNITIQNVKSSRNFAMQKK